MARSQYDELHDRYEKILTTKTGTRYERLAAVVFKCLDDSHTVIHDLDLTGETGAEHQIDVQIEVDGHPRHILIECKDFDISGNKVGLDIVRNFWAVMDDTKPDEGVIITCNDFTEDARIYAKGKGIKLATLRVFRDEDWENRIRIIEVRLKVFTAQNPQVYVHAGTEQRLAQLREDVEGAGIDFKNIAAEGLPITITEHGASKPLSTCVREHVNGYRKAKLGPGEVVIQSEDLQLQIGDRDPVPIDKIQIGFDVSMMEQRMEIGRTMIAELLLDGFGESDLVIFDGDLKRYTIDSDTGEVQPRQFVSE